MTTAKEQVIRGEALFEAGRFQDALDVFERVIRKEPENSGALNDAGLAATEVGELEDAERYFEFALSADSTNEMAFFNLLDLLVQGGSLERVQGAYTQYEKDIPDSAEKRRYYDAIFAAEKSSEAGKIVDLSGRIYGSSTNESPSIGMRIGFVSFRNDTFIKDIEHTLASRHQVKILHFEYGKVDLDAVQQLMDWSDVTWFEWCDNLLVDSSRRLRKSCHVVCRLHRFEAFTPWLMQVNWEFVDKLVVVAPFMSNILPSLNPDIAQHTSVEVIRNGVNLARFKFEERTKGFDLAFVASLRPIKNLPLLLQCIHSLVKKDPRYKLHIAGRFDDRQYEIYFRHMLTQLELDDHVILDGYVDDVSGWLADKQYIISTSVQEGCPYNVLEAAASGLKPVIHNFYGAEGLFPPDWLFNSTAEFVDAVLDPNFDSTQYRNVIVEQYEHEKQVREIETLLQPLKRSRMPALPVSIPAHPSGGDGHAGLIEPESVQPSTNAQWVALDDRYTPYISGREFHNGLRVSVDAQDGDVPARPDFLTAIATGMKVIDLGCTDHAPLIEQKLAQDNWVHKRLSEVADRCIGVDIDPSGIEAARSFGYDVLHLDIIEDGVPADIENDHWDFLVVGEVLEHIGDPVAFLSTIRDKYCDYVDRIVVTVPNALRIANFQFAKQGLEVVNSDHRFWFTPYTLAKIMTDAGLVIEGYRMLQGNPVTDPNARSFLLKNPLFREGVAMVARLSV